MLLERLYYPNDYPIRISVASLVEDPLHYHTDIEFVYVLKGEIELKNGYYTYHLHAGDIFTNSGNEVHGMRAVTEDNIVAQIHVRTKDLSHYFPDLSKACYRTYSKKAIDKRYERLRELVLSLLLKNRGQVLSRHQLMDSIWQGVIVTDRTVDVHITRLRKKLGPYADNIVSRQGFGYIFEAEPQ